MTIASRLKAAEYRAGAAEALVRQMGDMLLRIRSYADTAIGGEGYLVPPGGFYAIDAVLNDPLAIRLMEER